MLQPHHCTSPLYCPGTKVLGPNASRDVDYITGYHSFSLYH